MTRTHKLNGGSAPFVYCGEVELYAAHALKHEQTIDVELPA